MTTQIALFIETQEYVQDGRSTDWFSVNGVIWGLSVCTNGDKMLLDNDSCPVERCNDRDRVKPLLISTMKARQKATNYLFG